MNAILKAPYAFLKKFFETEFLIDPEVRLAGQ